MSENETIGISQDGVSRRTLIWALIGCITLGVLAAFLFWFLRCPCERLPGGYLLGEVNNEAVTDWSFANQVPLCQIQIDGGLLPHSLNLNCMATADGALYLSCSSCDGKRWSTAVQQNPLGRLRLQGTVYPVRFTRITNAAEMDRSWTARVAKLSGQGRQFASAVPPRPEGWWTFRLESAI